MANNASCPNCSNPDVFRMLVELSQSAARTEEAVSAVNDKLVDMRADIGRLYKRGDLMKQQQAEMERRVDAKVGQVDQRGRSFRDRIRGGWGLVLSVALLLDAAAHGVAILRRVP